MSLTDYYFWYELSVVANVDLVFNMSCVKMYHTLGSVDSAYDFTDQDDLKGRTFLNMTRFKHLMDTTVTLGSVNESGMYYDEIDEEIYINEIGKGTTWWKHYYLCFPASGSKSELKIEPTTHRFTFSAEQNLRIWVDNYGSGRQILDANWRSNLVILRIEEPSTGHYVEIRQEHNWGYSGRNTDPYTLHKMFVTSNVPGAGYEGGVQLYTNEHIYSIVNEDGTIYVFAGTGSQHSGTVQVFTPGNALRVSSTYQVVSGSDVAMKTFELEGLMHPSTPLCEVHPGSHSVGSCWKQTGYPTLIHDPVRSLNGLSMSGLAIPPCIGEASAPVGPIEYFWAGRGCNQFDGIRYANFGQLGRNGFLLDDYLAGNYFINTSDDYPDYYPYCSPEGDSFIASTCPYPSSGEYSFYNLVGMNDQRSVLSIGELEGSNVELSFTGTSAQVDLSTGQTFLIGPKNVIDYGLTGSADYDWYYYAAYEWGTGDPDYYWKAEAGFPYVADGTGVIIDEGLQDMFDIVPKTSRATNPIELWTLNTFDYSTRTVPAEQIDDSHIVFVKVQDSGSVATVTLELYQFNFSTEVLDFVASYSAYTTTYPTTTFPITSAMILFVPTHGSSGILYLGDPEYTGSKTNEGRVMRWTWNGSALTPTTDFASGIRNGFAGSCLGWDDTSDMIMVGQEDDILTYADGGSAGATYAGSKGDLYGRIFSVGTYGYTIIYSSVTRYHYHRRYSGGSWSTVSGSWGFASSYPLCVTNKPTLVAGVRYPRTCCVLAASNTAVTVYKNASVSLTYNTGEAAQKAAVSTLDATQYTHAYERVYYNTATQSGLRTGPYIADAWYDTIYGSITQTYIFKNGTDEYLCFVTTSTPSPYTVKEYHISFIGDSPQPHTEVGEWYITNTVDVSSGDAITAAECTYSDPDGSCAITFCFKPDNSSKYWINNGSGFIQYDTLAEAKAYNWGITGFASKMPDLSLSGVSTIDFWFFLQKTFSESTPLTSPKMSAIGLSLNIPALAEPFICIHFNGNERVKEVYKNTSDILTLITPSPPLAAGLELLVTGTFCRPLV
jgi:hypothetical protein